MKTCPFCAQEIPAAAKVCKYCNTAVVRKCPFCAEEIVAGGRDCRWCGSALEATPPAPVRFAPLGAPRDPVLTFLLMLFTCGLYALVVLYRIGSELEAHRGRGALHPGLHVVLTAATLGLWGVVPLYLYPRALREITAEEGPAPVDVVWPCFLLSLLAWWVGLLAAIAILQNELNRHWASHGAAEA